MNILLKYRRNLLKDKKTIKILEKSITNIEKNHPKHQNLSKNSKNLLK